MSCKSISWTIYAVFYGCHGDGTKYFPVLESVEEIRSTLFKHTDFKRVLFQVK